MSGGRRYDPAELERVRRESPIEAVVARHLRLRRRGRELEGLCPFHDERTPSFTVVPLGALRGGGGFFHCFGCGAHGDVIDFVMRIEGCDFLAAVEILGGRRAAVALDRAGEGQGEREGVPRAVPLSPAGEQAQRRRVVAVWRATRPIAGTPAEAYLASRLGLRREALAAALQAAAGAWPPPSLRFHPALEYWAPPLEQRPDARARLLGSGPALVAAICGPDRRVVGVHQTWIARDGTGWCRRAWHDPSDGAPLPGKKIRGQAAGGAIRLTPARRVMGSGEGIETTLAWLLDSGPQGGAARGAGAWAGISLGNLAGPGDPEGERLLHPTRPYDEQGRARWLMLDPLTEEAGRPARAMVLPAECRHWLLIEDHDMRDRAAADAAYERALRRAGAAGVLAEAVRPPAGLDWCDLAAGRKEGAAA